MKTFQLFLMFFIGNPNLLMIQQISGVSYNEPTFCSNPLWNPNGTTVVNSSIIGSYPYDIFINTNNTIFVPNQDNGQIIIWSEGNVTSTTNISTGLLNSSSLFVTSDGEIYVDSFHSIGGISEIIFNSTISISRMNKCQQCWDIFININNSLYCSLSERHQIISKSLENELNPLIIVGGTGTAGSTSNMLNNPRGIFVDITSNLYVADCGNNRIQLFQLGKLFATTLVGNRSANLTYSLNCPTDIILDSNKYPFIVDSGNSRIIGSDSNGFRCLIGCDGLSGSSSNQLLNPWAISFDSYGNIFVTDRGNNRIQMFYFMGNSCAPATSATASTTATTTTATTTTTTTTSTYCITTSITAGVSTSPMPAQCTNATLIEDGTRSAGYYGSSGCDTTGPLSIAGWFNFTGPGGMILANCPVAPLLCGTGATGWYSGVYPSIPGQTLHGDTCFNGDGDTCNWLTSIKVTNCNGYYVFYLVPPPVCDLRYCTV